jgi:predicted molibdopterin-dependent oxidoreductase YjgC
VSDVSVNFARPFVEITVDGQPVKVAEGTTLLKACRGGAAAGEIPTLCYGDTLTAKNACRVCMVEVEGSRTLVPSCSRKAEPGMVVLTDTERVRTSRRMVLEFLGSTTDLSAAPNVDRWNTAYGVDVERYGAERRTMRQPVKRDNELYVRDYEKCILCYKCVDACGDQWQNTFAIAIGGRGFDSHITTEFDVTLPDSACVFCGNCIAVCPTGALMFASEHDMRAAGTWDESAQTDTETICPYCGVGCQLTLHVQDNTIVKVTSPSDHAVSHGNLCIKGRFGFQHVQNRGQT